MLVDLLLIITLGFLGSFGHCVGMCGPLTVAFSLSQPGQRSWQNSLVFHVLLNLGRVVSYALVGAILGGIGSVVIASGQLAGVGSGLRQGMAILTGLLLMWFGLRQLKPNLLPHIPFLHPLQGRGQEKLSSAMSQLSWQTQWWTPALLGSVWGLMPCGFLYAAQIKAAQTGSMWLGGLTMLGFALGTMPVMLGVGVSASRFSASRRSQLFRMGGWVTLAIGLLTIVRSDAMVDYTGHISLFLLMLALIARPLSTWWEKLLHYRRAIGVGSFALAIAHVLHMLDHTLNWQFKSFFFLLPQHQLGIVLGTLSLSLMTPAACTSFDSWQKALGKNWRRIHLLTVPALILATLHTVLIGSHYLGQLQLTVSNQIRIVLVLTFTLTVIIMRSYSSLQGKPRQQ